jgi:predicted O-methyltransferase YrrM
MSLHEGIGKKLIRGLKAGAPVFDILFSPLTFVAGIWFRVVRFWSFRKLPLTKSILLKLGVFPIVDHYYEPLFDFRKAGKRKISSKLDFNDARQLELLSQLTFDAELKDTPSHKTNQTEFYFNNGSFEDKDARLYYSIIRKNKPSRIIEIGSGFSTLMAVKAITKNKAEAQSCELTCIEPYEMPYLEKLDVKLIRKKVEDIDAATFSALEANDILFIDSSHIIRPGGDVTHLLLSIVPVLKSGVWIHVHDIFLPEDYPAHWLRDEFRMWNEQYLLEALLTGNPDFEIVFALNYLFVTHKPQLEQAFPGNLSDGNERKPGSFWIRKR